MTKLIALVGTNSDFSTNRQLLQFIQKHFTGQAEIELVEIKDIPMFNKPADQHIPEAAQVIALKLKPQTGSSSAHRNTIMLFRHL